MRICFYFIAFVFLLSACNHTQTAEGDALVEVNGQILYKSNLKGIIPTGISSSDSLMFAENYIEKWVKDKLIYDVALKNLDDAQEVERLVNVYRQSLIRYRYQERLVLEKLSPNIRESDKLIYFEENQEYFRLNNAIVKGLFLKIPVEAPGLDEVKKWYKSNSTESLEKIEKYSIQNASIFDYFFDKWVDFDEVAGNIPVPVTNGNAFLQSNKFVEVSDSAFCYLLNIQEYISAGSIAPYDYAESRIVEMLINQKKKDFIADFENELYTDAVKRGNVKFLSTTENAK
ncbi:hypothetical protein [Massilibacteroides vaginae]|uniref:hypothetical protein n=1 Tax=Massilibacteroides vaginae TaxID=1673718 RepID=UPI000A1C93BE|nr:hypothetical protein [Massilibacteroides vaginae]